MKKKAVIASLIIFVFSSVYADIKIISPENGVWANAQALVLDVPSDENVFYSLNGSDPLQSGFAYDFPVLLDIVGPVELRIVSVNASGKTKEYKVSYSVEVAQLPKENASSNVADFIKNGIALYVAGTSFSIPSNLKYSLGQLPESYSNGPNISYSADCILSRYVPCIVTDGISKWRFIIKTEPSIASTVTVRELPFKIDNWNTLTFTNQKLIYKIDNEYWRAIKEPITISRDVTHKISWQSVEVKPGNPIESFELPIKPTINLEKNLDGSYSGVISGDGEYRFGIFREGYTGVALFDKVKLDTFVGDEVDSFFNAGIYYNSVYQGSISVPYNIDRKPPASPIINSSVPTFFSRKEAKINIVGDGNSEVFVAVSDAIPLFDNMIDEEMQNIFDTTLPKDFVENKKSFTLDTVGNRATYYKVRSYAVDKSGNKSEESLYEILIDKHNYFINASADPSIADGTKARPFTNFTDCLNLLDKTRFVNIRVSGTVEMPEGEAVILSNCVINGENDARLLFPYGSSLVVRSASLDISNCMLKYDNQSDAPLDYQSNKIFVSLEHSVLSLNNCEIATSFLDNGNVINANNSVININGGGITSTAKNYSSIIASTDSKIKIDNARVSTVAQTAVNFSVQGGEFDLTSSLCKVTGTYGRVAELFASKSKIRKNTFVSELKSVSRDTSSIYLDAKNVSLEYTGNIETGF